MTHHLWLKMHGLTQLEPCLAHIHPLGTEIEVSAPGRIAVSRWSKCVACGIAYRTVELRVVSRVKLVPKRKEPF